MKEAESRVIEGMLEELEYHFEERKKKNAFVEACREQWTNSGWLSQAMIAKLKVIVEEIR